MLYKNNSLKEKLLKTCALASAVLCLLTLTACHGSLGKKEFEMPDEFDSSRKYEISFWAKNDTNKNQTEIYEKAIDDFEVLYPNIKVNLKLYTDYGKIYNDVITNIATNTTPNVCITYPDHIATYLTGNNEVAKLNDLFADENYGFGGSKVIYDSVSLDEIVPQFLQECRINGDYYAIPFMRSTECCYINKTYVEKLGFTLPDSLTWDFIWEVSEAAMEKDSDGNYKVNGQKVMIPFIYKSTDNMMIQYLKQSEGGYSTNDGEIKLFNDTTGDFLKEIAVHASSGAFSTFKISGYPANFLNAGQCIFAVDSTAGSTWMGTDAPLVDISEESIVSFETEVMPIPQLDTSNPSMISQGPSICIFNKSDSGEVLASWLFAQYLLSDEVQISYAETEGYVPVTLSAQRSEKYLDYLSRSGEDNEEYYTVKIEASGLLLDNLNNTFVTPVFNGSASVRDAAGQLIEKVAKSSRRGKAIDDDYIKNLFTDVSSLYRLDQSGKSNDLSASADTDDPGALPAASKILIAGLLTAWAVIIFILIKKHRTNTDA